MSWEIFFLFHEKCICNIQSFSLFFFFYGLLHINLWLMGKEECFWEDNPKLYCVGENVRFLIKWNLLFILKIEIKQMKEIPEFGWWWQGHSQVKVDIIILKIKKYKLHVITQLIDYWFWFVRFIILIGLQQVKHWKPYTGLVSEDYFIQLSLLRIYHSF